MAVISRAAYDAVVKVVVDNTKRRASTTSSDCPDTVSLLVATFPDLPVRTLGSIHSLVTQRSVRWKHKSMSGPARVKELVDRFKARVAAGDPPGIILKIADDMQVPPSVIARFLVEDYARSLAEPDATVTVVKESVKGFMNDAETIDDRDLKYEVWLAVTEDNVYGPYSDLISGQIGIDYENILRRKLDERGIAYVDEEAMRAEGFDRTPDFKLAVPIAIGDFVVNWVESKASFGDSEAVEEQYKDQFAPYKNRFGSGLVIYWFGYVEDVDSHVTHGVKLALDVPESFTTYRPEDALDAMVAAWESRLQDEPPEVSKEVTD